MLCTWIRSNWTVIFYSWHACRLRITHTVETSHNGKKGIIGMRSSFLPSPKQTHKRKLPAFLTQRYTSKCHRWGGPGLYWDWCETLFPLWYTIRWWGARGFAWTAHSLWGPSVWEMLRRLAPPPVEEMDLLQVSLPAWTNYESDAHTHTETCTANTHTLKLRRAQKQM